jgi:phage terminase large subunit GpA-like protein
MIQWLLREKTAWRPPEKLTVTEWAEKHRVMDAKTCASPGPYRVDKTPYAREIMDTASDLNIRTVVICTGAQVSKTTIIENIQGYAIDQDQGPALVVYPTIELAEFTSDNRFKPMVTICPTLNEKFSQDSKKLELQFTGMFITLSGANSPASLASRPVRWLFFDETDKYPPASNKEADPISLGEERTKTFYNRKIYKASTPTLTSGQIWQALIACDLIKQYYVPCPFCGAMQTFKLKQVKWPEELNTLPKDDRVRKVRNAAWYECEHCHQMIHDAHKANMLKFGEWRPVKYDEEKGIWEDAEVPVDTVTKVGYQLNSLYSIWVSFGEFAAKFLEAKDFPDLLRNFINSWLGEPWRDKAQKMRSDIVIQRQHSGERGVVPFRAGECLLTAGVDVQMDRFWWTIRAWGEGFTGRLVDYGWVDTWYKLEDLLIKNRYYNISGDEFLVNLALIDSGYRTDDVYDFCSTYPEALLPAKGSSTRLKAPYSASVIEKTYDGRQWIAGMKLYVVDTHYFKDFIFGRLNKTPDEPGSWSVFQKCPREFADQICSEVKVEEVNRKNGRKTEEYRLISSHAQNHLLDCSVYDACAAEVLGIRHFRISKPPAGNLEEKPVQENWIPQKDWFRG